MKFNIRCMHKSFRYRYLNPAIFYSVHRFSLKCLPMKCLVKVFHSVSIYDKLSIEIATKIARCDVRTLTMLSRTCILSTLREFENVWKLWNVSKLYGSRKWWRRQPMLCNPGFVQHPYKYWLFYLFMAPSALPFIRVSKWNVNRCLTRYFLPAWQRGGEVTYYFSRKSLYYKLLRLWLLSAQEKKNSQNLLLSCM